MREFEKDVRAVWAAKDLWQTQPASDEAQIHMVLGSGDVAARSQPKHYIITARMFNSMVWLLDVYLNLHLPVVEPLPSWEESPVFGNVPARMEVAAVVRVVA